MKKPIYYGYAPKLGRVKVPFFTLEEFKKTYPDGVVEPSQELLEEKLEVQTGG